MFLVVTLLSDKMLGSKLLMRKGEDSAGDNGGIKTGNLAIDFSFTTIDGENFQLSDFRGKYVLFAFIATWCIPCQIEAENSKNAQDLNDFVVIQIDVDSQETNEDLINFREKFGKSDWLMVFDKNLEISKIYNAKAFDTTLMLDPAGKIVYRDNGWPMDEVTFEKIFEGSFQEFVSESVHEHIVVEITIDGEKVDLSQEKYNLTDRFVHLEDGDGGKIHLHSKGVYLGYFLGTLGWQYKAPCLKTDFGSFCDGTLRILVDGEEKNLNYEFEKDGFIEFVYE